jgi:hypothetical protein
MFSKTHAMLRNGIEEGCEKASKSVMLSIYSKHLSEKDVEGSNYLRTSCLDKEKGVGVIVYMYIDDSVHL